ncbi:iron ABC transporter permease [Flavobacterium sp. xlx-214]|uniref:FecCD family ABC transporter permease n=1 Tax=unclassified Flavobacterium TaxID=196869 RepID=UPI0013D514B0|nr:MULTISPECIES: iron ABC transporter permease [unclassified Flavobacterium]MBA5793752.1 iron ABC transporter permease [Flavobacterium sp. xlx-221]QMI83227.1 iron ABC transporter permease [Flavobacterium sp. xlx-214]
MKKKIAVYKLAFFVLLTVAFVTALYLGAYDFNQSMVEIISTYLKTKTHTADSFVLIELRIPRILMAILTGAALAISGTSLQGLFKNPLASPDLIGITSGAVLFAALTIVFGSTVMHLLPAFFRYVLLSIMAFVGALTTMWFVYKMATSNGKTHILILLLSGVAITALSGAVTGFLTYISTEEELRNITFWSLGSLAGSNWWKVALVFGIVAVGSIILLKKGKVLNALMLGEKEAVHLGFDIEKNKRQIIIISSLMVGSVVAFNGTIGFIGLVVPYILRFVFNSNYNILLPLSMLLGAVIFLIADTMSRLIVIPAELPIGILTALMGAPVFISILINYKRKLK